MKFLKVFLRSFIDFFRDGGLMLAGSISYFSMMALVPLCIFLITVFGSVLGHYQEFYLFFSNKLSNFFPEITSEITEELRKLIVYKGIGTLSLFLYGFLSLQLFASIEHALNIIFEVKKKRTFFWSLLISLLMIMFLIFILLGVVAEVLFISTTVVLNILDRETEFISLRAIGTKPGKIRSLIIGESLILLAGGLAIGLPLGVVVTKQAMAYMVEDLMYYVLEVPLAVYVYTSLIAVFSALGAAYVSARWVTKSDLPDTIRNRLAR